MSLFKKPKKNIRQRVAVNYSDEENEVSQDGSEAGMPEVDMEYSVDGSAESKENSVSKEIKQEKKKKKKHKDKAVISFIDEEEEGEIFQVKKSSQSRRLAKQIEKERKMKEMQKTEVSSGDKASEKPTEPAPAAVPVILSGRDAEMAGYSSDEDARPVHNFSTGHSLDNVLRGGAIPDAATIHAVRKRREQARRQHETAADFIPAQEGAAGGGRPEQGDDSGPEDDRVTFTVNTAARDKEARRDQFNAARDQENDRASDDDDKEIARWENQQIKKAFSGQQLSSVAAEHYMLPVGGEPGETTDRQQLRRPLAELTPHAVRQRLQHRLGELRQTQSGHQAGRDRVLADLVAGQAEIDRLEREAPRAARRYQYYQDIRGYVTDLIECFNEKIGLIEALESRMTDVFRARAQKLIQRRRTDVRDQRIQLEASTQKSGVHYWEQSAEEVSSRRRRAAEREGRRTRRRRARELSAAGGADHTDGLSSDDEVAAADTDQLHRDTDEVLKEAALVLEDVEDDFSSLSGLCRHFLEWRQIDGDAYRDAYVSLSLPRAIAPLVRLQMVAWNPLSETECVELEKQQWYADLVVFGAGQSGAAADSEDAVRDDPDMLLVSRVVERAVLPKITTLVERVWDPLSNSQTLRLVHLVRQLIRDYPTVTGSSGPLHRLLKAVVAAFTASITNDVFVPRFPKQVLDSRSSPSAVFFSRQFTVCVKLLGNMLSWSELLSDTCLQRLALGALLNDTMLLPLTQVTDPAEAVNKCKLVANTLPRGWFQGEAVVPQLTMLVSYLSMLAAQINKAPSRATHLKTIVSILKKVGAEDALKKVSVLLE